MQRFWQGLQEGLQVLHRRMAGSPDMAASWSAVDYRGNSKAVVGFVCLLQLRVGDMLVRAGEGDMYHVPADEFGRRYDIIG